MEHHGRRAGVLQPGLWGRGAGWSQSPLGTATALSPHLSAPGGSPCQAPRLLSHPWQGLRGQGWLWPCPGGFGFVSIPNYCPVRGRRGIGMVCTEQAEVSSRGRQAGDPQGRQEGEQNRPKPWLEAAGPGFLQGREGTAGCREPRGFLQTSVALCVSGAAAGEQLAQLCLFHCSVTHWAVL